MSTNKSGRIMDVARKYILEILLLSLIVIMCFVSESFLSTANFINIIKNMALQGVLAFGMTMVIIGGEIDLSISSTVAFTGVAIGLCCKYFTGIGMSINLGFALGLFIAVAAAFIIGIANTYFITKYKLPAMIVTIAMQFVVYGFTAVICGGFPVINFPGWYSVFGAGDILGIPVMSIVLLIVFAVTYLIMQKTKIGRSVYAVGGNPEAARLSGINVVKTKCFILIGIQLCAVVSGILLSSQVMSGSFTFAKGWEMTAIASAVIGGTSFNGGIGKIRGTFIGLAFLGVILNAMVLLNVNEYIQYIVRGGLILFAVVINTFNTKRVN